MLSQGCHPSEYHSHLPGREMGQCQPRPYPFYLESENIPREHFAFFCWCLIGCSWVRWPPLAVSKVSFQFFVVGGGEDWKWVGAGSGSASQPCWLAPPSPVRLLGFSPVEIASYVLKETRARIVTGGGCIACKSKSWNLWSVSRQTIRLWCLNTTDDCKATEENELNRIKYTDT